MTTIQTEAGTINLSEYKLKNSSPIYLESLTSKLENSSILNQSSNTHHSFLNLADTASVRNKVEVLQAKIEELELDRSDNRRDKVKFERRQINRGHPLREGWQTKFDKKTENIELEIDCKKIECNVLQELLTELQEHKDKVLKRDHASMVLKYGPKNMRRTGRVERYFEDGVEVERRFDQVDYQDTGFVDGVLCIDDDCSPYNGMAVYDYVIHIARPFLTEKRNREVNHEKALQEWAANGSIPNQRPANPKKLTRDDWPKWPKSVKNFKAKQKQPKTESVRESTLIRTT